jgi:hypothetical protein
VNLSRSGAASQPRLFASLGGRLQAFWVDRFDGLMTAVYDSGAWSTPAQSLRPAAQFSLTPSKITVMPVMVVDDLDRIYGFWYGDVNPKTGEPPLLYSQSSLGTALWTLGSQVAESALVFAALPAAPNDLQLAMIRPLKTEATPPGVFTRRQTGGPQTGGARVWSTVSAVDTSIYYRILNAEEAFIQAAVIGQAAFLVWQEPRLDQVLYSFSTDGGATWSQPVSFGQPGGQVREPLLTARLSGEVLRIWQDASQSGCVLYQQQLSVQLAETPAGTQTPTPRPVPRATPSPAITLSEWSEPRQVLAGLENCPQNSRFFSAGEKHYWLWGEDTPTLHLSVWDDDLEDWSLPQSFSFSFDDPETKLPVQLDHLHAALSGDRLAVIGDDGNTGEVWSSFSQVSSFELAFASPSPWSAPLAASSPGVTASYPALTIDGLGRAHAVWSQGSGSPGSSLFYARIEDQRANGQGTAIQRPASPVEIFRSPAGEIVRHPFLQADPSDHLHLAWSGGAQGEIYYSRALTDQAGSASGWLPARMVSAAGNASWPQIATALSGRIYILYTVPLNETRGVYLVYSDDQGETWSAPLKVFDAQAASWEMIDHPTLAIAPDGSLHAAWAQRTLAAADPTQGIYYTRTRGPFSAPPETQALEPTPAVSKPRLDPQWIKPIEVASAGSDWPRLAVIGGQLHLVFYGGESPNHRWLNLSQQTPEGAGWATAARLPGWQELPTGTTGETADETGAILDVGNPLDVLPYAVTGDAATVHLVMALTGRLGLRYAAWTVTPDGIGGRWSPVETFAPSGRWRSLPGAAAAVPIGGGSLAVAWLALPELAGKAAPAATPATPAPLPLPQVLLVMRAVPEVAPPAPPPAQPTVQPSATPPGEPTPARTATPLLSQQPSPGQSSLSPLVLGSGLAAVIVIAIFIGVLIQGRKR